MSRFTRPYDGGANDPVRLVAQVAGVLSIGAGVIHISAAGDHTDMPRMFTGFLVVAALQIGLGALLIRRRPSRLLLAGAVALMVGAIVAWLLSRTSGLPLVEGGHEEPIGFKDGVTVLFEVASIPPLLLLASSELGRVTLPSPRLASQTLTALGAGVLALMTPAMLLAGGDHEPAHEQVATHERAADTDAHGHGGSASAGPDPAHVGASSDRHAERRDGHARRHARRARPSGRGGGQHGRHSDVELASLPTGGGHGHTAPTRSPQRDHSRGHHGGDRGDRTHRDRHDGHRPRRGKRGGGHGDHEEPDGADEPDQPLEGVVADVMELVPGPAGGP